MLEQSSVKSSFKILTSENHARLDSKPLTDSYSELTSQLPPSLLNYHLTYLTPNTSARKLSRIVSEKIGITRLAHIGGYLDRSIFVCQTTRPRLIHHYRTGINTGSQGKGYTEEQAAISAIMEAAETYCAETRNPQFVRGSYATLAKSHIVAPPQAFIPWDYQSQVSDSDVFMWSPCWHFQSKTVALVPSEVIYTFHIPEIFGDVARFPASSAGVAAGFDLQKCLFKSVTEIIEQHYRAEMEALRIKVDWIKPEGFVKEVIARTSREFQQRAETHFFLIRLEGQRYNLPFVICLMGSEFKMHTGWGLNPSLKAAIESAHLEAFQSWATLVSGVRENIVRKLTDVPARLPQNEQDRFNEIWPDEPTLSYSAAENLCTKNWNRDHSVESLIQFLESIGYPSVYLANLSRAGIPCFVTKAIVPNLTLSLRIHLAPTPNVASNWSWAKIASFQYNYIHRRKSR